MNLLPFIPETQEIGFFGAPEKKDKSHPGFSKILEEQLERRRREQAQADGVDKGQQKHDFAMQKFYQSMLLSAGGTAPVMTADPADASAVTLEALKVRRCGSRRLFARDSDLFSTPKFPVTCFKGI
jgi:hypothetical protein